MSIDKNLTRKFHRTTLQLKKQSPHIFFGLGIAGVIAGNVLACKATLGISETLDRMRDEIDDVKSHSPKEDRNRDLARVYTSNCATIAKAYAPATVVTGLSIAALTGSHITLTKRNTALTAAYAGLQKAYDSYRDRVREELGEERELDIYHGAEEVKDGKVVEKVVDPNKLSIYARFFDEASTEWRKDAELNRLFVTCQQNYLNQLLQVRGHVFLNEAYDALGLERSSAGQVVGWIIGEEGDNYIDFGLYEASNSRFINGTERSILLDFNVDGVIYDKI